MSGDEDEERLELAEEEEEKLQGRALKAAAWSVAKRGQVTRVPPRLRLNHSHTEIEHGGACF